MSKHSHLFCHVCNNYVYTELCIWKSADLNLEATLLIVGLKSEKLFNGHVNLKFSIQMNVGATTDYKNLGLI